MMSRVYDERVFTGPEDLVMSTSSSQVKRSHRTQRQRQLAVEDEEKEEYHKHQSSHQYATDSSEEGDTDDEDSNNHHRLRFPLQSPRGVARAYQQADRSKSHLVRKHNPEHFRTTRSPVRHTHVEKDPIELVYLPNGSICSREECPIGISTKRIEHRHSNGFYLSREEKKVLLKGRSVSKRGSRRVESSLSSSENSSLESTEHSSRRSDRHVYNNNKEVEEDHSREKKKKKNSKRSSTRENQRLSRSSPQRLYRDHKNQDKQNNPNESSAEESHRSKDYRLLEIDLQEEKKRVLEKMTQLLEEQGKNHMLQTKVEEIERKLRNMEEDATARVVQHKAEMENALADVDRKWTERVTTLEQQLEDKASVIVHLEKELQHVNKSKTQDSSREQTRIIRLKEREAALANKLEELMNHVTTFHSQVESWKKTSREAMEYYKTSELMALMEKIWMDFPSFIAGSKEKIDEKDKEESSNTVAHLKQKLRALEDELRLVQVKNVELKEMCARQCIREADLQNFINEHRLRGNLTIQKTKAAEEVGNDTISTRSTFTRATNTDKQSEGEDSDKEEDHEDVALHRPKVQVEVRRYHPDDDTGRRSRRSSSQVEHIRLEPSPRYQRLQKEPSFRQLSIQPVRRNTVSSITPRQQSSRSILMPTISTRPSSRQSTIASTTTRSSKRKSVSSASIPKRTGGKAPRPSITSTKKLSPRPWI